MSASHALSQMIYAQKVQPCVQNLLNSAKLFTRCCITQWQCSDYKHIFTFSETRQKPANSFTYLNSNDILMSALGGWLKTVVSSPSRPVSTLDLAS